MKKITKLLMFTASVLAVSGCNKKTYSADDQVLRVFATSAGYGHQWLVDMLNAFKEEDWVKEKYPNLVIEKLKYDSSTIPGQLISSGEKACPYDLVATCQPYNDYIVDGKSYFEDLSGIWEEDVPGESVKLKNKIEPSCYESEKIRFRDGSTGMYTVPYARSWNGVAVNMKRYKALLGNDTKLPRTTDEWLSICATLRPKMTKKNDAPFCFASKEHYGEGPTQILWAQYEGAENYTNYFKGIADGEYSCDAVRQQGKLEALKVMENLIGFTTGNFSKKSQQTYYLAQSDWASGDYGVFCIAGDWLYNEMGEYSTDTEHMEMRLMRMPVISAIKDTLPTVDTDATLIKVVDAVDDHKTYDEAKAIEGLSSLSAEDYQRVKEARNYHTRLGGHSFAIPSYSMFKEIAKDFVRFSATDKAASLVNNQNCISPWKFDAGSSLKSDYARNTYQDAQDSYDFVPVASYPLVAYAGLKPFYSAFIFNAFCSEEAQDRKTAQQIYDTDCHYYCDNDGAKFNEYLATAGLK